MIAPTVDSFRNPLFTQLARARVFLAGGALAVSLLVAGCAGSSRTALTEAQLYEREAADMAEMAAISKRTADGLVERVWDRQQATGEQPTLHFLAMSGGGANGAFGAGVLSGWGTVSDPEWRRPVFDVVTGVSTGAMLAPFAYVGTDEAIATVEELYRNPKSDWVRDRGLLFFWPSNDSFATIPGLERDIRAVIDASFVEQMAEQSRAGKALLISATDLDFGRQRLWEVGEIAQEAAAAGEVSQVADIMLASSAIPVAFPSREINGELYGDGGVTANVLVRLDPRNPDGFIQRWFAEHPGAPLPKVRFWVIVNSQMAHVPKTVQTQWPVLIGPSLETAIRFATQAQIRWLAAEADYVNLAYDADIEVRVIAIPNDWRPPVHGQFKKETMDSLADLGRQLGADPKSWRLWTIPVGAAKP
jgi:hypothetical protein